MDYQVDEDPLIADDYKPRREDFADSQDYKDELEYIEWER